MKYSNRFIAKIFVVMFLLSTILGMPGVFAVDPPPSQYLTHWIPPIEMSWTLEGFFNDGHSMPDFCWVEYTTIGEWLFYLAVRSTDLLDEAKIGSVSAFDLDRFSPGAVIRLSEPYISETYDPTGPPALGGDVANSHWTVFRFDLEELEILGSGTHQINVKVADGSQTPSWFKVGTLEMELPTTATVRVEKTWKDEGPKPIPPAKFQLVRWTSVDGPKGATPYKDPITVTPSEPSYTWTDLDLADHDGNSYTYFVEEIIDSDYEPVHMGYSLQRGVQIYKCTNYGPSIELYLEKIWEGGPVNKPPVTIHLLQNNIGIDVVTLEGSKTSHFWGEVPEYDKNGVPYKYSLGEETVKDYTPWFGVDDENDNILVVKNTYTGSVVDISVEKIWEDAPAAKPPVTIHLLQDDEPVGSVALDGSETDPWKHTWLVPEFDNEGEPCSYTISEETKLDGYEFPVYGQLSDGTLTVTNKKIPPAAVEREIPGKKELKGRELKADEFGFSIYNASDLKNPIQSVKNAKDGTFSFLIEFKQEGKYELVIKEDKGNLEHMVYDGTEIEVDVLVTEDAKGFLVAEVTSKTDVIFKNAYDPPKLPDTGGGVGIGYLLAGLALLGVGGYVIISGRKKREQ